MPPPLSLRARLIITILAIEPSFMLPPDIFFARLRFHLSPALRAARFDAFICAPRHAAAAFLRDAGRFSPPLSSSCCFMLMPANHHEYTMVMRSSRAAYARSSR